MNTFLSQFLKKEGLVLLLFTLLGYGVALSYELGYAIYFSFDTEYIQVDIRAIYVGIINVLSYFLVALVFATVFKQTKTGDAQKLIQIVVYILLIIALSSPLTAKVLFANAITTLMMCMGIFIFHFTYVYLANKDALSLPVLAGIGCLFAISMSTTVGISRASTESALNVFKYQNSEYAIIRIYNGNIVGIKVENEKLSHKEKIYIPSSEVKTMVLRTMRVQTKPGLLNYKKEYPTFPKNSLGDLILLDKE
ncbi:hypothetical protein ACX43S_00905 [Enterobacter cloacae]